MGANCTGAKGEDVILKVPVGTTCLDEDTGEKLGDLTKDGDRLLVAREAFTAWAIPVTNPAPTKRPHKPSLASRVSRAI